MSKGSTDATGPLRTNTHVHVPPNASSDTTLKRLMEQAQREELRAMGTSNFFDMQVFDDFATMAPRYGIYPLFGVEIITFDSELAAAGWTVNDPQNPGRYYLQGRGLDAKRVRVGGSTTAHAIRQQNDLRAARQVELMSEVMTQAGFNTRLTATDVIEQVASAAEVPVGWVSLQERHIARAFADSLLKLEPGEYTQVLHRALGKPVEIAPGDAGELQTLLRAHLLKNGQPAFVPDSPVSFAEGHAMVLELGGIPTYCAVADGVDPICDYETPATDLAKRIRGANMHAAELITARNTRACVDEYISAFEEEGLLALAGSEHNTPYRVPLALTCSDGPLSDFARAAVWEGTCVLAAHQDLVSRGEEGFVRADGSLAANDATRQALAQHGASLIAASSHT